MLAFDDIVGYLHYYAFRFQSRNFEHWELINEAWMAVHRLNNIKFASQGIRWAMLVYKKKENQHRRYGSSSAVILPLETNMGINKLVMNMTAKPIKSMSDMDNIDTISWLANNACLSLDERMVIDQRFGKGMTMESIACDRQCSHQNVYDLIERIIAKLCRAARRLERHIDCIC